MNLMVIYRTFYPIAAENVFFSTNHGMFSRTDHMLDHKISLDKFKKTEIMSSIFLNHNSMKLGINTRRHLGRFTNEEIKYHGPEH